MLGSKQQLWVDSLKSELYPQGKDHLRIIDGPQYSYCCLGVANLVCNLNEEWDNWGDSLLSKYTDIGLRTRDGHFLTPITVNKVEYKSLTQMNDAGKTFYEIATIIENYWFLVFERPV